MKVYTQPDEAFLRQLIDALPFPALVVDNDVRIEFANRAAAALIDPNANPIFRKRGGEVFGCLHAQDVPSGCGCSEACKSCIVRGSVCESFKGQAITRRRLVVELKRGEELKQVPMMLTANPFTFRDQEYCILVLEDISELISLQDLLPICASCKKIRDDQNYWHHVEQYVSDHVADITFTHSLCPECTERIYPRFRHRNPLHKR